MENDLQVYEENPLCVRDIQEQVKLIQDIMKSVMKDGEHYGIIPGCKKPSLLKPGAEKLSMTFRMAPKFQGEENPRELGNGHREYIIKCSLYAIKSERFLAEGVGSCSTMESKYRFRTGPIEFTGKPVPKEYWNLRESNPLKALELLGGKGFQTKKNPDTGQWEIVAKGEEVENDNPADQYNTVLKMAKKRAHVDAILTATAASDIFTQDVEETVDSDKTNGINGHEEKPSKTESQKEDNPISEAQRKRFYAIAKSTGATDEQIKEWLYREYGFESTRDITRSLYEEICTRVENDLAKEPGTEG